MEQPEEPGGERQLQVQGLAIVALIPTGPPPLHPLPQQRILQHSVQPAVTKLTVQTGIQPAFTPAREQTHARPNQGNLVVIFRLILNLEPETIPQRIIQVQTHVQADPHAKHDVVHLTEQQHVECKVCHEKRVRGAL